MILNTYSTCIFSILRSLLGKCSRNEGRFFGGWSLFQPMRGLEVLNYLFHVDEWLKKQKIQNKYFAVSSTLKIGWNYFNFLRDKMHFPVAVFLLSIYGLVLPLSYSEKTNYEIDTKKISRSNSWNTLDAWLQ